MLMRVEFLALRVELLHAMLFEHLEELALGELDAVEEAFDGRVRLLAELVVERLQGALHIVGHRHDVARKLGDAILARVSHLALGAPAQVLHFGQRAQPAILVLGRLARQNGRRIDTGWIVAGRPGPLVRSWIVRTRVGGVALLAAGRANGIIRHRRNPVLFGSVAPDIRARPAKIKPTAAPASGSPPWRCSPPSG